MGKKQANPGPPRGIPKPPPPPAPPKLTCPVCEGTCRRMYGNTGTWRPSGLGIIVGQAFTEDVCDSCWGTGEVYSQGENLREKWMYEMLREHIEKDHSARAYRIRKFQDAYNEAVDKLIAAVESAVYSSYCPCVDSSDEENSISIPGEIEFAFEDLQEAKRRLDNAQKGGGI